MGEGVTDEKGGIQEKGGSGRPDPPLDMPMKFAVVHQLVSGNPYESHKWLDVHMYLMYSCIYWVSHVLPPHDQGGGVSHKKQGNSH